MSVEAWAIKHPDEESCLLNSITRISESWAWCRLFGNVSPNHPLLPSYIADMKDSGFKAVRVRIAEVEEVEEGK